MSGRPIRATWARERVVALLLAGAVLAVALAFIISRLEAKSETITFEFYKLLMQALLIGAVGAFLSAAIQEARHRRDSEERRRTFARERIESLLHDIDEDYRLVKRSRRMLRLERPIRYSLYRTEMVNLEDIQRSFEALEADITKLPRDQWLALTVVKPHVSNMKKYVEKLWSDFEKVAPGSDEEPPQALLLSLDKFIDDSKKGSFHQFRKAIKLHGLSCSAN